MNRLALTTSTDTLGVGLATSDGSIISSQLVVERRHAEEITLLISELIEKASLKPSDLDQIVVDIGPGRFTGLRVGIATAIGLGIGTKANFVPVTSLEVLVNDPCVVGRKVAAVIDGRRGEVFQQIYSKEGTALGDPVVDSPESVSGATANCVVVGDGADLYGEIYRNVENVEHIVGLSPNPEVMLSITAGRQSCTYADLEPLYLRGPDATPNIKTRHNESA